MDRRAYLISVFDDTLERINGDFELHKAQQQSIAGYCGYEMTNHHHALADAEACAIIAKQIL